LSRPLFPLMTPHIRPYQVSKDGVVLGWVLARGYENAYALVAKNDGYEVSLGSKTKEVTVEAARCRPPQAAFGGARRQEQSDPGATRPGLAVCGERARFQHATAR
jgi:hypothetical protein